MLTAIPVGQGDAFLLQRKDGPTILVDGGRSATALPNQVGQLVAEQIDVVVCTHADADHTDGLIGLLDVGLTPVKEVWLPGRWTSRLEDLLRGDEGWLLELAEQIERTEAASLEEVARRGDDESRDGDAATDRREISAMFPDDDREGGELPLRLVRAGMLIPPWFFPFWTPGHPKQKLLAEAINAANRIRALALAAHHHGAKIRWFDFDEASRTDNPQGGEAFLQPLNAVEITTGHALRKLGILRYLALSVANRESLVFAAPEGHGWSGVVFAADSDMACSSHIPPFSRPAAITAPHHGSESNAAAYQAVASQMGTGLGFWIRSDGNFPKRPGKTFLQQTATRACTLCRGAGLPKQAVQLVEGPSGWALAAGGPCKCK